jgi:hypothetical protein
MSEQISITLHGTSDQLDVVVDALRWARDLHGFAASQCLGEQSRAHRAQWKALREVLERADEGIATLRIGTPHT